MCEEPLLAEEAWGRVVAEQLQHRLADMMAARSPLDLVAGSPSLIGEGSEQYMSVSLADHHRLVIRPNPTNVPFDDKGDIVWLRVSRVRVERVEVDHD